MTTALIGYTGFVGGYLASRMPFDLKINRENLVELRGARLERVVCAGLPAAKWLVNQSPAADRDNMRQLEQVLRTVSARRVVLISTIDVYPRTRAADEDFDCGSSANHAYGENRLAFERFVREQFRHALILRLPALFGPGLRKNVLFDLLHGHRLECINPASRFQWYSLARLPADMETAEVHGLMLANLFTEPLPTGAILGRCFPKVRVGERADPAADYDLQTRHAAVFGGRGRYRLTAPEVLTELSAFCAQRAVA